MLLVCRFSNYSSSSNGFADTILPVLFLDKQHCCHPFFFLFSFQLGVCCCNRILLCFFACNLFLAFAFRFCPHCRIHAQLFSSSKCSSCCLSLCYGILFGFF